MVVVGGGQVPGAPAPARGVNGGRVVAGRVLGRVVLDRWQSVAVGRQNLGTKDASLVGRWRGRWTRTRGVHQVWRRLMKVLRVRGRVLGVHGQRLAAPVDGVVAVALVGAVLTVRYQAHLDCNELLARLRNVGLEAAIYHLNQGPSHA